MIRFLILSLVLFSLQCKGNISDSEKEKQAVSLIGEMQKELLTNLTESIQTKGIEASITHCSKISPELENKLSHSGWNIKRISQKNRNPHHFPDVRQLAVLKQWETVLQEGKKPEVFISKEGSSFLVMKPILLAPNCVVCHGNDTEIDSKVRSKILEIYPNDKAIGYKTGDLRGAFVAEFKE
ncbi:Tll0287-like domain-containing protein [Leptospira idonii]|uniref:DUF3365 domain-containing protein n=1 Tax=Leptospira idonii TaxID=1193500 RepID=A0A4R9M0U1_9LEPT|nr:DUF3365 domain-containing protein [Leptospira idonii]TGN20300.1 DUF3365 domain-containing protein [Leptospira idonii]